MQVKSFLGLALALVPAALAETGPFFDYCTTNSLYYSNINSECTGGYKPSIDLNQAIAYDATNGLTWNHSGGFYAYCGPSANGNCDLSYSTMTCKCTDGDRSINLDQHLYYDTDGHTLFFSDF